MNISDLLKKYKYLIVTAVFLRILVSILLFHPDIKTINYQVSHLRSGITDIYSYVAQNKANLSIKEEFVYFPLTYFTLGGYNVLAQSLLGRDLLDWLAEADANQIVDNPKIFEILFVLKLPLMAVDLMIAFLLFNYFKRDDKKEKAFLIWLFNPFTIILIYAYSNIDLYMSFLTLSAILLIKKQKILISAFIWGIAISFKLYPLLFIPYLFLKGKNSKEKILIIVVPFAVLLATTLPFWSKDFVNSALISGLSTRIFYPNLNIGFGESIILSIFLMVILFLKTNSNFNLVSLFTVFLLIIFSTAHYHVSWLLWIAPFLAIILVKYKDMGFLIILFFVFGLLIPAFYADRAMTISLFRIYSTWFDILPTPFIFIQKIYDPYVFQSMLHSVFSAISVVLAWRLINKDKENRKYE